MRCWSAQTIRPYCTLMHCYLLLFAVHYVLHSYYYEAWILPALMRQEKMQYNWNAAWKKYHENIWKFNWAYDR